MVGIAGLVGAASVAAGAFGAHALRDVIGAHELQLWGTAAQYHQVHAVAILAAAWAGSQRAHAAATLWLAGVLLFSGSLYALAVGAPRALGVMTPLGGVCLIAGWLVVALSAISSGSTPTTNEQQHKRW